MFRPAAFLVIGFTIFLAVFAARVSGKTMVKTIQQTDLEGMLSLTKDMTNLYPDWNQTNSGFRSPFRRLFFSQKWIHKHLEQR